MNNKKMAFHRGPKKSQKAFGWTEGTGTMMWVSSAEPGITVHGLARPEHPVLCGAVVGTSACGERCGRILELALKATVIALFWHPIVPIVPFVAFPGNAGLSRVLSALGRSRAFGGDCGPRLSTQSGARD